MGRRRKHTATFSLFAFQDIITSVTGIMLLITMMLSLELIKQKEQSPPVQTQKTTQEIQTAIDSNENQISELRAVLSAPSDLLRHDQESLQRKLNSEKEANAVFSRKVEQLQARQESAKKREQEAQEALERTVSSRDIEQLEQRRNKLQQELSELKNSNRIIFNRPEGEAKAPWLIELSAESIQVAEVGVASPPKVFTTPEEFKSWAERKNKDAIYFVMMVKPSGLDNFLFTKEVLDADGFDVGYDLLGEDQQSIDSQSGAGVNAPGQ